MVEETLLALPFAPPQAQGQAHAIFLVRRQQYLEALLSSMSSQTTLSNDDGEEEEQEEKDAAVPSPAPSPLALLRGPVAAACAQLPPEMRSQILHSLSLLLLLLPPPPLVSDGKKQKGKGKAAKGHGSKGMVVAAGMTPQERAVLLCRAAGWAGGGEAGRRALLKCVRTLVCYVGSFIPFNYPSCVCVSIHDRRTSDSLEWLVP